MIAIFLVVLVGTMILFLLRAAWNSASNTFSSNTISCGHCGREIYAGTSVCQGCGAERHRGASSSDRQMWGFIIGSLSAVLGLCAGGAGGLLAFIPGYLIGVVLVSILFVGKVRWFRRYNKL